MSLIFFIKYWFAINNTSLNFWTNGETLRSTKILSIVQINMLRSSLIYLIKFRERRVEHYGHSVSCICLQIRCIYVYTVCAKSPPLHFNCWRNKKDRASGHVYMTKIGNFWFIRKILFLPKLRVLGVIGGVTQKSYTLTPIESYTML